MKLKTLGNNQTVLETNHGWLILYSYDTPVAGYNPILNVWFKTTQKHSLTTTRHINKWLDGKSVVSMEQADINNIGFLIGEN